jgi:hypothetical protein
VTRITVRENRIAGVARLNTEVHQQAGLSAMPSIVLSLVSQTLSAASRYGWVTRVNEPLSERSGNE